MNKQGQELFIQGRLPSLKKKLKHRQPILGSWITVGHPSVAEIMATTAYDFLTVDMEHSAIELMQAQILVSVIQSAGICPLVRVGENDPNLIKRVMDTGASGVIVPLVNSKNDALKAVESVKYPPKGIRGVGLARAQGYGLCFEEYKMWLRESSVVIALIEHIDAMNNLEEIFSVEGLDGTLIGPYDLSGSMGHPGEFDRKDVREVVKTYEAVSRKFKKPMGYHVVDPDPNEVKRRIRNGYQILPVGMDTLYLANSCKKIFKAVRNK